MPCRNPDFRSPPFFGASEVQGCQEPCHAPPRNAFPLRPVLSLLQPRQQPPGGLLRAGELSLLPEEHQKVSARARGHSGLLSHAHPLSHAGEGAVTAATDLRGLKDLGGLGLEGGFDGDDEAGSLLHQSHQQTLFASWGVVSRSISGKADCDLFSSIEFMHLYSCQPCQRRAGVSP